MYLVASFPKPAVSYSYIMGLHVTQTNTCYIMHCLTGRFLMQHLWFSNRAEEEREGGGNYHTYFT